jgi:riboflavin synthase
VFTGIIETKGTVKEIKQEGSNKHFYISSPFSDQLKIDQSVAHNGVCLTVVEINGTVYKVTAIDETLKRTNLGKWEPGTVVNLERCMPANGRFDGHIVQGHVDDIAFCQSITDQNGSWLFRFNLNNTTQSSLIVEKGSICINGISLTVVDVSDHDFSVAIIPYTFNETNMHVLKTGDTVNIEFDIIGKYIAKQLASRA